MTYWNQSTNMTPSRATFYGQAGWFRVPLGWDTECDGSGQWWATSNTGKRYAAKVNVDGSLVFQDALLDRQNT